MKLIQFHLTVRKKIEKRREIEKVYFYRFKKNMIFNLEFVLLFQITLAITLNIKKAAFGLWFVQLEA